MIDKTSPYSKAAGDQGSQARLVCRAEGAPNISFSWSRHGQIIGPSTSSSRYKQETRKVDLTTWDGILTFSNIQSKDYGNYECVARNDLGFETWTIKLNGTS